MKQWISLLLTALLLCTPAAALEQPSEEELSIGAPAAILIERETGTVLYEKNADERLSPASVTKIMTLLLIFEQLDSGRLSTDAVVTASTNACAMGGSQIWLREGEQMTVDEMIKCIAVSSANDCAVAMAEHICGSEAAFTKRMNERAQALGMENTHFLNSTGLTDDPAHYTTARDIAVMSRALLAYPRIRDYTTIWMDTVRDGRFALANTQVIPAQIRRVDNLIFRKINQFARENGVEQATPMHGWIIEYLYRHRDAAVFQRDIEREFSITRSTVTNILQLMERKGYIERRSVPQDARLKQLVLTEEGIRFHENTIRSFHQTDDYVAGLLTEEENTELLRLLNKLRDALQ